MPDTIYWTGGDQDLNNPANYSTSALPVDDDTLVHPPSVTKGPNTNMNALAGVRLAEFRVMPGATGNWGGSGNRFEIRAQKYELAGNNEIWLDAGTDVTVGVDACYVNSPNLSGVAVDIDGDECDRVILNRGHARLASTASGIALVHVGSSARNAQDAKLTISSGVATIAECILASGLINCENTELTRQYVRDGKMIYGGTAASTYIIITGGTYVLKSSGTQSKIVVVGPGVLDLTQAEAKLTITDLFKFRGGTVVKPSGSSLVAITNEYDYEEEFAAFGSGALL